MISAEQIAYVATAEYKGTIMTTTTATLIKEARDRVASASLGHIINGVSEPVSKSVLEVIDPGTGDVIARISKGTASDVDRAVAAARAAFSGWRSTSPSARSKILHAVADRVDANAEELAMLESLNAGKPVMVSRAEIEMIGDVFRFLAGAARAMQSPATEEYVSGYVSMIRREPVGVIGAITPWNYPLLTAVFKMAGVLAVGNTMVLKPSELTPLTTLRFMELVSDILPAGVVNIVLGTGEDVGSAISQHSGIDMISLTGSIASGQRVMSDAAVTLKPTHLELGGKAPVVIFDDADIDAAVAGVRMAGFANSGQECGAATRVLCSKAIVEKFTETLISAVSTFAVGSVLDGDEIEMGPLISKRHLDMVSGMVSRARDSGASIVLGGDCVDRDGFFFPPTIITGAARGSEITTQEIFGPVVTIQTFEDEADAIALANSVAYGLSASVWTSDVGRALRMSSALDFGTVWVNAHLILATEMPWGGFGGSGHGRELSTLSLEDFSRTKHVMIAVGEPTASSVQETILIADD
jgi:1-pyrroline dehydrogenase